MIAVHDIDRRDGYWEEGPELEDDLFRQDGVWNRLPGPAQHVPHINHALREEEERNHVLRQREEEFAQLE